MSSEISSCRILITGIKEVDEEDLKLFFESRRFCPNGGDIEDFRQLNENEGVITFKDSEGQQDHIVNFVSKAELGYT